jgi:hypothetical protein
MNEFSLFFFLLPKIVFISLFNLFNNRFNIILFRDGINLILVGINSNRMYVFVHFKGGLLMSVVGSKIENRFLKFTIFFILLVLYVFLCLFGLWLK